MLPASPSRQGSAVDSGSVPGSFPCSARSRALLLRQLACLASGLVLAACGSQSGDADDGKLVQTRAGSAYVRALPECQTPEFKALLQIDHRSGDFDKLIKSAALISRCTTPTETDAQRAQATKDAQPHDQFVNFEIAHVHPLDLTPSRTRLLAVNTAAHSLEVYDISNGRLIHMNSLPVGLSPVSVRARNDNQAWVVNKVSDTISIVDLNAMQVTQTLQTDDEPGDVVFATSAGRAFVSCAEPNLVQVFELADLSQLPTSISIQAEEPRAMAISSDGSQIFVAAFESGNGTTALNGRLGPVLTGAELGSERIIQSPQPNNGNVFSPALTAGSNNHATLIVRKDGAGQWRDDNDTDWSQFISGANAEQTRRVVGWDLPDRDVAVIDVQSLTVSYQQNLMNILMSLDVNPATGAVTVVGTDAINEVRFEPNLNGRFIRVKRASFVPGQANSISDLNPHLDYASATIPAAQREQSLGDPRGIVWNQTGQRAYITGMGSNNVIVVGTQGQRLGRFDVGEGPTGIKLDEAGNRGFALNKFSGSISEFDIARQVQTREATYFDPTPPAIKRGRPFLYNTHLSSGLGQASCASCHVDARTDRLAWDLGNPGGSSDGVHSPMKAAMLTQSLQDIMRFPSLHWRGDRADLAAFNPTYTNLMGAAAQISASQMQSLGEFLDTIHFAPNPYRNPDNSLPTSLALPANPFGTTGNAVSGRAELDACLSCHTNGQTRSDITHFELTQNIIPPAFHGFRKRIGYDHRNANASTSGFGYFHDGVDPLMTVARGTDLLAALLTYEGPDNGLASAQRRKDTHAAVGRQLTLTDAGGAGLSNNDRARLNDLLALADSPHLELIAKRYERIQVRGFMLDPATANGPGDAPRFISDRPGQSATLDELLNSIGSTHSMTFTLVPAGTGTRIGIDRDFNGLRDGQEPDFDGDGVADVIDADDDNDGVDDFSDAFRFDGSEWTDTDGDGLGDNADTDDDADGVPDREDLAPLDSSIGREVSAWACNRLADGSFEAGSAGPLGHWRSNTILTTVADAQTGAGALRLTGGWASRVVSVYATTLYTLSGAHKSVAGDGWAGFGMDFIDANGSAVGESVRSLNASDTYAGLNLQARVPANASFVRAWFYADADRELTLDDIDLRMTGCDYSAPPTATPFVANPGAQTHSIGSDINLPINAQRANGASLTNLSNDDPLTFTATGLPTGLQIDNNTGAIRGAALQAGSFTSEVTASDGAGFGKTTFDWAITDGTVPVCNLLPDPGFEGGIDSTSNQWLGSVAPLASNVARSGVGALAVHGSWISTTIDAQPGSDYLLSGYVSGQSNPRQTSLGIDYLDARATEIGENIAALTPTSQYAPFSLVTTAPPDTAAMRIWCYAQPGANLTLDDLDLRVTACRP